MHAHKKRNAINNAESMRRQTNDWVKRDWILIMAFCNIVRCSYKRIPYNDYRFKKKVFAKTQL